MLRLFALALLIGMSSSIECRVVPVPVRPAQKKVLPAKGPARKTPIKPPQKKTLEPAKRPAVVKEPIKRVKQEPGKLLTPTVTHGDLQCRNVVYDEIGGHYGFIDLETILLSLSEPLDPRGDFEDMFNFNIYFEALETSATPQDRKLLFENTLKPFVEGYASAFAPADQRRVLLELKEMFLGEPVKKKEFPPEKLKEFQRLYIEPIFDELLKKFPSK